MDILDTLIIRADKCDSEKKHPEAHCYRKAADEIARLRAELERVKCAHSDMAEMYRKSRAELEAALVDAERYRWLEGKAVQKTAHDVYGNGGHWSIGFFSDDSRNTFDAAIDAAMGKDNG